MRLLQSARLQAAGWLDQIRQDVHYALRALARSKGFTLSAISVLAVGIGVNVGILHILNAALFHRLSVQDAESLIDFDPARFSFPMVEFFRKENTVFSRVFAESAGVRVLVEEDAQPEGATFVSSGYFSGLGLVPSQGRLLDPADNEAAAAPVAMLGYRYWLRRFGGDPGVVGRVIRLNGVVVQVVGVAPADFTGLSSLPAPEQPSLWIPVSVYPELFVGSPVLSSFRQNDAQMYAALRPGVELQAANAQLVALAAELKRRYPDEISMRPEEAGRGKPLLQLPSDAWVPVALVTALFLLVLVTACANLGILLLARGFVRTREIAIRVALGAGASRIVRQLMTENLLLAALGAIAGLGVGYATARGLLYVVEAAPDLRLVTDWRIVAGACVLALGAALTFGLAPARQAVRTVSQQMAQAGAARSRSVLVGVQVAAACVLLVTSAMLARSFTQDFAETLRFDPGKLAIVDPQLGSRALPPAAARDALDDIAASLARLPNVHGVTAALYAPLGGAPAPVDTSAGPRIRYNAVDASYFNVMNLPLTSGRLFSPAEEGVVVLGETTAKRLWPGEDPLGKTVTMRHFERNTREANRVLGLGVDKRVVVGIVADSSTAPGDVVEGYLPLGGNDLAKAVLVLAADDPAAILRDARAAAALPGIVPATWLVSQALENRARRGVTGAVAALGTVAMLLAAMGLFGVTAFAVVQRTQELGIRIALGARRGDLLATVLGQYVPAVAAGSAAGCLLAVAVGQVLRSRTVGIAVADPIAYLAALAVLFSVALLAVLVAALGASRVDPVVALRHD